MIPILNGSFGAKRSRNDASIPFPIRISGAACLMYLFTCLQKDAPPACIHFIHLAPPIHIMLTSLYFVTRVCLFSEKSGHRIVISYSEAKPVKADKACASPPSVTASSSSLIIGPPVWLIRTILFLLFITLEKPVGNGRTELSFLIRGSARF